MSIELNGSSRQVANGDQKHQDAQIKPSKGKHNQRSVEKHPNRNDKTKPSNNLNNKAHESNITDREITKAPFAKTQGLNRSLGDLPLLPGQSVPKGYIPSYELNALKVESKEANSLSELGKTYEKLSDLSKKHLPKNPSNQGVMPFHDVRIALRKKATTLVEKHFKDPARPTTKELKNVSKQVSKLPDPRARRALKTTFNLPDTDNKTGKSSSSPTVKAEVSVSEQLIASLDSALGESIHTGESVNSPKEHYPKSPKVSKLSQSPQPKKVNAPHAVKTAKASQNSIDRLFAEARNTDSYTKLAEHIHQLSNSPTQATDQSSINQLTQRLVAEVLTTPIDCEALTFIYHKFMSDEHPTNADTAVLNGILDNCEVILTQESDDAKSLAFNICRDIAKVSREYHPQLEQLITAASPYRQTSEEVNDGIFNIQMAISFTFTDSDLKEEQRDWVLARNQLRS